MDQLAPHPWRTGLPHSISLPLSLRFVPHHLLFPLICLAFPISVDEVAGESENREEQGGQYNSKPHPASYMQVGRH